MTIGEKIKELRIKNDLTQEKLADYLFVSYQAVSKWECGLSNPDLSLIGPLTKLFNVTADELLCITSKDKVDERYNELKKLYNETWRTGSLEDRFEICKKAVIEYPGDMFFLCELGYCEAMLSFSYESDEDYNAAQERAIKLFARVIEDCTDTIIRNSAISGIVQYLSYQKRYAEARKYLELYPEDTIISKDDLLEYCLVGKEKEKHHQKQLFNQLNSLLRVMNENEMYQIETKEKIIDLIITDKNYLCFHQDLNYLNIKKASLFVKQKEYLKAIECLKTAKEHAIKYDELMKQDKHIFTTPFLNLYDIDLKEFVRTGEKTELEEFMKDVKDKRFAPLNNFDEYQKLISD
ncbi:MAG: helix-turn-helix transcriptional regulator [Erysipelotrichaceae bacterium]|nr:helix-turn-helix transcriptional regulator [Erysipelotrichaceae bacterium]